MAKTRWHFIRHGQSVANAEGWLAGHTDSPLSELGEAQTRARAAQVQALPVERVYTSDLSRAWRTAELLVGDVGWPIQRTEQLRERALGEWDRASDRLLAKHSPELMRWDLGPPGGEAPRDVARRFIRFFAGLPEGGETLVVAHGLALKAVLGLVDGTPTEAITSGAYRNLHREERWVEPSLWTGLLRAL